MHLLVLLPLLAAPADPPLPGLVRLEQAAPRSHAKLSLPRPHTVGPTIPGLRQGAVPQGLAYWEIPGWFLVSCYFEDGRPSVVVALDRKSQKVVRCLTLLEPEGKAHAGHVGGLAVSDKYLWVASGRVYRVPLSELAAAKPVAYLRLRNPFRAESTASYAAYHAKRLWVGEFVGDDEAKPDHPHRLKDRNGTAKYAWVAGYTLDADDELTPGKGGQGVVPAAVLCVRQKVQGLAFLGGHVILSVSYGRKNDSTLAVYADPTADAAARPHARVKVQSGQTVPLWFLDGKNRVKEIKYPPMSEGITPNGKRLAVICESGAAKYQKGGRGPLDSIIFLTPLDGE